MKFDTGLVVAFGPLLVVIGQEVNRCFGEVGIDGSAAYTFRLRAQIVNVAVLVTHGRETSSSYAGMANR
ncbi:hypothetical protein I3U70_24035 [Mycobacteroides abscessus subsp. abscessus]|nr:hypothetical protein [Mycobacteroides abscessus subsp. abscessus]